MGNLKHCREKTISARTGTIGRSARLLLLCVAAMVAGCSSQERLTSRATPCATKEVKILGSEFSRRGTTTAWCAECKGQIYQCATDIEHTKVECRPSTLDDVCR